MTGWECCGSGVKGAGGVRGSSGFVMLEAVLLLMQYQFLQDLYC